MNVDSLASSIGGLGQRDFRNVVALVLKELFDLIPVSVDGRLDGGSDWRLFSNRGDSTSAAYQDTTQEGDWESKAFKDAEKALNELGATRYFFLTSRTHSNIKLRQLEGRITSNLHIPATCIGGREIAGLIVEKGLIGEYLNAVDAPEAPAPTSRPDFREIALHAYATLGQDAHELKNTVYDDSILNTSFHLGPLGREELLRETINLLGCEDDRKQRIHRRVDSLLTRGMLVSVTDKKIGLSPSAQTELENAERIYLKEFDSLVSAQASLMEHEHNLPWSRRDSEKVSVYLARAFIQRQLDSAQKARITLDATGLFRNLGDPVQDLRDYLREKSVPPARVQATIAEMLEHAKDLPIVKKLSRVALYVALEGGDPISCAKAIGAPSWSEVRVMLDASVAIPYLCGSLYEPSEGRFSSTNHQVIRALCDLSADVVTSYFYVNECAAHLLLARDYLGLDAHANTLCYSRNGFVAHYYQLKRSGADMPPNMVEYLSTFSPSSREVRTDRRAWIRKIMTDLQPLFHEYGVGLEEIRSIREHFRKSAEEEYAYQMRELGRTKVSRLVEHDVSALAHICRQISEAYEHWILLTWDRALIGVGNKLTACGWVVNPSILYDFVKVYRPPDEAQLCTLAHAIARTQDEPLVVSAQIMDRIVAAASDRIGDWKFREEIVKFTDELLARIDLSDADYPGWVDKETDDFLAKLGINVPTFDELEVDVPER